MEAKIGKNYLSEMEWKKIRARYNIIVRGTDKCGDERQIRDRS